MGVRRLSFDPIVPYIEPAAQRASSQNLGVSNGVASSPVVHLPSRAQTEPCATDPREAREPEAGSPEEKRPRPPHFGHFCPRGKAEIDLE